MVDWQLAAKIAEGVAALQPSGDRRAVPGAGAARGRERAPRLAVHGPQAARGRAARGGGREPRRVDRGEPRVDARRDRARGRAGGREARRHAGRDRRHGAAGAVLAVEAGAISGFLAGRVLGQYEFPVLDPEAPARLLFVAPNLGHAATQLEAEPDPLLYWVALHEITHALQFGGVPWLRPHLAGLVQELTGALSLDPGQALQRAAGARRPQGPARHGPRGRRRGADAQPGAARPRRPRAGLHGRARGLRGARDGRRRRRGHPRAARAARPASSGVAPTAPACSGCSRR